MKLEMDEKQVVETDKGYRIWSKDELKDKYYYVNLKDYVVNKVEHDPNKICVNNYALKNDPIGTAENAGHLNKIFQKSPK